MAGTAQRPAPERGEVSWAGRVVWGMARAVVWLYYRVERVGGDVPEGPVLLVANHSNGLLDPAIVVATASRWPRVLAKSTLFGMPLVGWLVRGAGSIPVYRRQDAGAEVERNLQTFEAVQRALTAGGAVCLFPEGISHSSGRLEPLKTGAARIALAAAAAGTPVRVVPVGINFQEKAAFRSNVLVAYGPPFAPEAWLDRHRADPVAAARGFTDEIARHLRDVVVEAEPLADVDLVAKVERLYAAARRLDRSPGARLERRRLIATGLGRLRARDPERYAVIYEQLRRYERRRARFGLAERGYLLDVPFAEAARFVVRELAWALALVPVALAGTAVFLVPYQLVRWLVRVPRGLLDQAATWKAAAGLVLYLGWIALLTAGASRLAGSVAAWVTAAGLPLLALAALFALEREGKVLEIVRGYLASRLTADRIERRLLRRREAIADLLDETWRWLNDPAAPTSDTPARA